MKLINHLREFYGFPQAVLAQYVGVSRGHLSMAAIGRKDLQTAAFLKLIKLALAERKEEDAELENIKASHRTLLTDKEASFVNYKILETEHRLLGCQRKLRRMQIKYRQAIHGLACLAGLQANPEDPDRDHYKIMEMFTRKVLDKNSEVAQLDLELRIAGLTATAEFLRQRVAARESLAAAEANSEDDNKSEVAQMGGAARIERLGANAPVRVLETEMCFVCHEPWRMGFVSHEPRRMYNENEVAQIDGAPQSERIEAKATNAPVRPVPILSGGTQNGNVFREPRTTAMEKNSKVAQLDLESRIAGLKVTADFLGQRVTAQERLAATQDTPGNDNTMPRLAHVKEMRLVFHKPRRRKWVS